jgi:hypothetical protein
MNRYDIALGKKPPPKIKYEKVTKPLIDWATPMNAVCARCNMTYGTHCGPACPDGPGLFVRKKE